MNQGLPHPHTSGPVRQLSRDSPDSIRVAVKRSPGQRVRVEGSGQRRHGTMSPRKQPKSLLRICRLLGCRIPRAPQEAPQSLVAVAGWQRKSAHNDRMACGKGSDLISCVDITSTLKYREARRSLASGSLEVSFMTHREADHGHFKKLLESGAGKKLPLLIATGVAALALVGACLLMRENRAGVAGFALSMLIGACLMVAMERPNRTVEAEKFILRDETGKVRGALGMTPNGPSFSLFDEQGRRRATLGLGSNGPALVLYDPDGKSRSWLYSAGELTGLVLQGGEAKQRAELAVSTMGANLGLFDANGETRARMGIRGNDPAVNFRDANGKIRAALGIEGTEPVFALYDANEKRRAGLAVTREGPALGLYDANGKIQAGLTSSSGGPALAFLDANEKVIYSAP